MKSARQPAGRAELTPSSTIVVLCGVTKELRRIREVLETSSYPLLPYGDPACLCEGSGPPASYIIITEQPYLSSLLKKNPRFCFRANGLLGLLVLMEESALQSPTALLCAGVAGFLEGGCSREVLLKALKRVEAGELWASRKLVREALRHLISIDDRFTRREFEILQRISAGQNNRQIAEELFITRDTVRGHLRSAYTKLGVHDRRAVSRFFESEEVPTSVQSAKAKS